MDGWMDGFSFCVERKKEIIKIKKKVCVLCQLNMLLVIPCVERKSHIVTERMKVNSVLDTALYPVLKAN